MHKHSNKDTQTQADIDVKYIKPHYAISPYYFFAHQHKAAGVKTK